MTISNLEIAPKETEIQARWHDARFYCFALNIDGKTGWRLPTVKELGEIWSMPNDLCDAEYWSATNDLTEQWDETFDFKRGYARRARKYWPEMVRAVRDCDNSEMGSR